MLGGETDSDHDGRGKDEVSHAEVGVVKEPYTRGPRVLLATAWSRVHKVENHAHQPAQMADHYAAKCALEKTVTCYDAKFTTATKRIMQKISSNRIKFISNTHSENSILMTIMSSV